MNSRYDNLLAGKDQIIKALWTALAVAACSALFMGVGWMLSPNFLRVYVPPDLSNGAVLKSNEVGKANVYSFGYYIWQQLYRWEKNAVTDYEDKIHMMQNYLTPSCFQNRLDDFNDRSKRRELERRERAVWEIPGRGFAPDRVRVEGNGTWIVYLDLYIRETLMGESIKERFVNYPIRIVRYDIDPEKNAFGLAVDCLADTPRVILAQQSDED